MPSLAAAWVASNAGLWAPDIRFFNGQYYLYYTASDTSLPGGGSAIGVATSASPLGPWTDSGAPVVEPHEAPCCPGSRRWVYDPDVVQVGAQKYIFYGSYFGGVSARTLSPDGLHSDPASQVQITIANRYEGTYVVQHGSYYLPVCLGHQLLQRPSHRLQRVRGPLGQRARPLRGQGRSVHAGGPRGRHARHLHERQPVGGYGPQRRLHRISAGRSGSVYHAIDRTDPYFAAPIPGRSTERP